mmetsp:Transcript_13875/g.26129  ORF Transcript_13875/g.26129 Transcript_13875/m.26129 type:complete len:90 (+) Transcript_13875:256-525(+)
MGNEIKGAMALQSAKKKADSMLSSFDKPSAKKKEVIENPETRREMNQRHKLRDQEFKQKQEERKKKQNSLKEKWAAAAAAASGGAQGGR